MVSQDLLNHPYNTKSAKCQGAAPPSEIRSQRSVNQILLAKIDVSRFFAARHYGVPGSADSRAPLPGLSFQSSASSGGVPLRVMLGHSAA
jgi:hypothetical protein